MGNVFPRTAADVVGPQRRLRLCEDSPEDKRGLRVGGKVNSLPVLCFRLFSGRRHGDPSRRRLSCTVGNHRDNWCSRLKGGEDTVFLVCVRIACRGLFLGKPEETLEAANRVANDLLANLSTSQLGRCSRASPPTT